MAPLLIDMIKKSTKDQIPLLKHCLDSSFLQDNYFNDETYTVNFLMDAFNRGELYTFSLDDKPVAFMRIDPCGMFSKFPLLRCIAVKPEYRNRGIAKEMLKYYENLFQDTKLFLCVSELNNRAKKLYLALGYKEVGNIPDLYRDGTSEYLMCKRID